VRINLASVLVDDQDKALRFYTEILGFVKKTDVPVGEARWLTVVSPDDPDGTELLLEPDGHPAAKPFKQALVDDGIPYTSFAVDDVKAEYDRLRALGVRFTQEPLEMQSVTTAVLDDTCGNLDTDREPEIRAQRREFRSSAGAPSMSSEPVEAAPTGPRPRTIRASATGSGTDYRNRLDASVSAVTARHVPREHRSDANRLLQSPT
jgi:catechol 2,3-dioxygenase-like lactoylglutathione lyase family enzyme